jgi:hypothetical protein
MLYVYYKIINKLYFYTYKFTFPPYAAYIAPIGFMWIFYTILFLNTTDFRFMMRC